MHIYIYMHASIDIYPCTYIVRDLSERGKTRGALHVKAGRWQHLVWE